MHVWVRIGLNATQCMIVCRTAAQALHQGFVLEPFFRLRDSGSCYYDSCSYCIRTILELKIRWVAESFSYRLSHLLRLVKALCECTTGITEHSLRSRDDNAWGAAECVIDSWDCILSSIIPVVYEHERCFNWFVARFQLVFPGKIITQSRPAILCDGPERGALVESHPVVAPGLLALPDLENVAADPNYSVTPDSWLSTPSEPVLVDNNSVNPTQYNFQRFLVWHLLYCWCLWSAHASWYNVLCYHRFSLGFICFRRWLTLPTMLPALTMFWTILLLHWRDSCKLYHIKPSLQSTWM